MLRSSLDSSLDHTPESTISMTHVPSPSSSLPDRSPSPALFLPPPPTYYSPLPSQPISHWKLIAVQHPDFWFHDGSIVLCVDKTLFRVHQTILGKHSEIFDDLFNVPQPTATQEDLVEGCRVVLLHDAKEDFVDLLNAIYHPSYFDDFYPQSGLDDVLTFVGGILRLSTKYLIRSLRQRCIALLISKFPITFSDYQAKSARTSAEKYKTDSIMRAIRLAQETNVPEILPYAFYCVARMNSKRLLKPRDHDISWKDKTICVIGKERLRWAEMSLSHSFLLVFQPAPTCTSYICSEARSPHAEWHVIDASKSPNPLRLYSGWNRLNVCSMCIAHCQGLHQKGREEVWQRLPSFFEMGTWESLRKTQNMADSGAEERRRSG